MYEFPCGAWELVEDLVPMIHMGMHIKATYLEARTSIELIAS